MTTRAQFHGAYLRRRSGRYAPEVEICTDARDRGSQRGNALGRCSAERGRCGVIVTPPAAETVADSVPATPLPPTDRSCSSRNRSYATVAAPSSDDMSSDEEPRPHWNLVKHRKKRKMTEMSPSNTVSDSSPKSGGLLIVTDSSFETY